MEDWLCQLNSLGKDRRYCFYQLQTLMKVQLWMNMQALYWSQSWDTGGFILALITYCTRCVKYRYKLQRLSTVRSGVDVFSAYKGLIRITGCSFGNLSRPINARFINHYQCIIFITRLINFAEFSHIEETSCLCTTRFERLQIPHIWE